MTADASPSVLICYAEKDMEFAAPLARQLQSQGFQSVLFNLDLSHRFLTEFRNTIVVLLLSPAALRSSVEARNRAASDLQAGQTSIIPVLARRCDWKSGFASYRVLPENLTPLADWTERDAGLREVVAAVLDAAATFGGKTRKKSKAPNAPEFSLVPEKHPDGVTVVMFSESGSRWITAGADHRVILWEGRKKLDEWAHSGRVGDAAISPDGKYAASLSVADGTCRIWSANTEQIVFRDITEGECLALSNDNLYLARQGAVWCLHLNSHNHTRLTLSDVSALAVCGDQLLAGTNDGDVFLGLPKRTLVSQFTLPVRRFAVKPGTPYAGVIADGAFLLSLKGRNQTPASLAHPGAYDISLSAKDSTLTVSPDYAAIWAKSGTAPQSRLDAPNGTTFTAGGLSPDGRFAILGCDNGDLLEWRLAPAANLPDWELLPPPSPLPTGPERLELAYLAVLANPRFYNILETFDEATLKEALAGATASTLREQLPGRNPPALWSAWARNVHKDKLNPPTTV